MNRYEKDEIRSLRLSTVLWVRGDTWDIQFFTVFRLSVLLCLSYLRAAAVTLQEEVTREVISVLCCSALSL